MFQRSEGASGGGVAAALATGAAAAAATTNGQPHTGNLFSDAASEISRVCCLVPLSFFLCFFLSLLLSSKGKLKGSKIKIEDKITTNHWTSKREK